MSFDDASFFGSTGAVHLNPPIVDKASRPHGGGYWQVASDGDIVSFDDASFFGSTGAVHLDQHIVATASHPNGNGSDRAELLETQTEGLEAARSQSRPDLSAPHLPTNVERHWFRPRPVVFLLFGIAGFVAWRVYTTPFLLYLLYVGVSLLFGAIAATTLIWMVHAWRTPNSLAESRFRDDGLEPIHSFSLIVPARHEEAVLERTLARIVAGDHPDFEVIVVVGDDDPATRQVAEHMADLHPELINVIVDDSSPKNKPKALNAALPHCRGTVTGVFDAEDDVHPLLLRRVDQCLQKTHADIVQAGVQLMNFQSSWFTVHSVLEYYFWFRSRLHLHARQRFVPLGGNTVFIRTEILRAVGGWDPDCLAEDCELGVRLSSLGARTVVFYEPELVTREECPPTIDAFVRQRTRWNQGYIQTLSKRYWTRLPLRQRALGAYILAIPYALAVAWLLVPIAIGTAVVEKVPVPITLISILPVLPILSILVVEAAGLGEFCREYGERASFRDYVRLVVGLPLFQVILAFAAARAVTREATGAQGWEKTTHLGLHLGPSPSEEVAQSNGSSRLAAVQSDRQEVVAARRAWPRVDEALVPRSASLDPVVEQTAAAISSSATDHTSVSRHLEADPGPEPKVSGNGHSDWPPFTAPHFLRGEDAEPLWIRLNGSSAPAPASISVPSPSPADTQDSGQRPRGRLRRMIVGRMAKSVDVVVQIPLLIGVGLVQMTNAIHWPGVLFDEGTYVGNAWAVGHRGELAFYTYTYGHPPLGWLFITLWTSVGGLFGHGAYSLDGARELMGVVTIVSCSLLYTLARRLHLNPLFAAGAVLLFALSPLALFFHRGVLLDNFATAWAIAAFMLARSPKRHLWAFAGSGACFAASVLSKETTLVILPALLLAAFQNTDSRTRRYCMTLLISSFLLVALGYPLYATLKGELVPGAGHVSLFGAWITMLFTRGGTGNVLNPHSLAHGTVTFWLSQDFWLVGAGLIFSPIALVFRNSRAIALAFLIQIAIILRPGYLPAMYVIAILPFAALIVASSLQSLWRFTIGKHPRPLRVPGAATWRRVVSRLAALLTPVAVVASAVAIVLSAVVATLYVAPRWARADHAAVTLPLDGPELATEQWLLAHVGHQQRVIVTDDIWVYLIQHGFDSQPVRGGFNSPTVVSYWPLDKDPAVTRYFPDGWREFDYIVSNAAMRDTATFVPNTEQALAHSRLVAGFGQGGQRMEIRAITPTPQSGGALPGALEYAVPASGVPPSLNDVALTLGVNVNDLISATNRYPDAPTWWYYEGRKHFGSPLPTGTILHYTRN
ncbi:MAG TPA: glycosyltransferase [Acidimicrobiales bacterium]|nr:glycosyltransferase [Acidimicrobiales bacterium]